MGEESMLQEILAKKKAGVERMKARQARVHGMVADYIMRDEGSIPLAATVVERKLREEDRCFSIAKEWDFILANWEREEIAGIFRSMDAESDQLRACSPFVLPNDCGDA